MNKLRALSLVLVFWLFLSTIFASKALAQTASSLTVATYNVESPRLCDPTAPRDETLPAVVAEHIRELAEPALWGLSEVPDRETAEIYREAAEFPGSDFELIFGTQGTCSDKLAILYNRNRLELVEPSRELIAEVGGDRAPLVAQFRSIPDGAEFFAVANHFARGNRNSRNRQATNLRNWIEQQNLPVITLGDFNMDYSVDLSLNRPPSCEGSLELGNEAFEIFTESDNIRWIQPQCLANGTCPIEGTGCFLPCFNSILDFVFVGGNAASDWTGTSEIAFSSDTNYCANEPLGGADHRPVLATLNYPAEVVVEPSPTEPSPSRPTLKIAELFPNPVGGSQIEIQSETVTIANLGDESVELDGWQLRDAANTSWSLFGSLRAGQRIEFRREDQPMALNNSGDTIELVDPNGIVVDTATYFSTTEGEAIVFSAFRP